MNYNEGAVFKWVLIVGVAAVSIILLAELVRPLVGALWMLVLLIVASAYGIRWVRDWRRRGR